MSLLRSQYRRLKNPRIGLIFALLLAGAIPSFAQHAGTAIVFYAPPQVSEEIWPEVFQALRDDLALGSNESSEASALDTGVLDPDPTLVLGKDLAPGIDFHDLLQVKLIGRCDVLPQVDRPLARGPLGWVLLVSGHIQPFVTIDCTRLAQTLRPVVLGMNQQGRRHAMAQAIAHVLIHEWIHVATQSTAHSEHGITQAYLSVDELIGNPGKHRSRSANGRAATTFTPSAAAFRP